MSLLVKAVWIFKQNSAKPLWRLAFGQEVSKPVFACAGYIGKDVDVLYEEGMTAILEFWPKPNHWKQH